MPSNSVSVTLALGEAPYQETLVSSLLEAGMLRRVLRERPRLPLEVLDSAGGHALKLIKSYPAYSVGVRAMLAVWRRLPQTLRPDAAAPILAGTWLRDQLMCRWVDPSSIFHACTFVYLDSLLKAKRQGAITLVDHAARHEHHWRQARFEEQRRFGAEAHNTTQGFCAQRFSAMELRRMDRIFSACDRIVVPSEVARQSFVEMGYADKVAVVATGVDHHFFSPRPQNTESRPFRVCFVGRLELAKGIVYLLQAWRRLSLAEAELVVAGAIRPEMRSLIESHADKTVRFRGVLSRQEVAGCYRESTISVMPSVNEGLAQVLLEAMASGLPVVATDLSGANDCMSSGKEGIIVPARDVDALADAILWCYRHRDEIQVMGKAARARIESQFTLDHYNQRIIALYRALVTASTQPQAER